MKINEFKTLLKRIEAKKNTIAKEIDGLREMYDEIGDLLESFDCGIEFLDKEMKGIEDAIDSMSEVVS